MATAAQVRQRFPRHVQSDRTARRQLAWLVAEGYLGLASVRAVGPNFPHVFVARRRGLQLVKRAYAERGVAWKPVGSDEYRTRGRAASQVLHEVLLTQFYLDVWRTAHDRGHKVLAYERRYFAQDRQLLFKHSGRQHRLIPDAGFVLSLARPGRPALLAMFVELDNGSMSLARVGQKLQEYARWAASPEGQAYLTDLYARCGAVNPRPEFRLLVVAGPDEGRVLELLLPALDLAEDLRRRLWLTSFADLRSHQGDPLPLSAPIWLLAADAAPWLREYEALRQARPPRPLPPTRLRLWVRSQQRRFVARRLATMTCHSLFPNQQGK